MAMKKLHEIIKAIDNDEYLSYEEIQPYLASINAYVNAYYCCNAIFMITAAFNAGAIGKIVPENEFIEAIEEEIYPINDIEDKEHERELISFNSIYINQLKR